jgi:hypothetical protein
MHGRHDDDPLRCAAGEELPLPKSGHNRRVGDDVAQWQAPHLEGREHAVAADLEVDVDLIEVAFIRGLATAPDPTSFLRVAQIPFDARTSDGTRLVLLRVETESISDVASVTPHLGGASFRYDPLPGRMVTRRERLRFVYFDGREPRVLSLASVRGLRLAQSELENWGDPSNP